MYTYIKNNINLLNYCKISFKKVLFIYVISLIITALEATGLGLLLPIGEYLLNSPNEQLLNTASWQLLYKMFNFFNISPSITYLVVGAIFIILIRQLFSYIKIIYSAKIQFEIARNLRNRLFSGLIEIDLKHNKSFKTGASTNLATTEIHNASIAGVTPFDLVSGVLLLISYFAIMTVLSWKATLVIVLLGFIIGLLVKKLNKKLDFLSEKIIDINNIFSQYFMERLKAIKLIKLNHRFKEESIANKRILQKQYDISMKVTKIYGITATGLEPVIIAILLPILVLSVEIGVSLSILGMFAIVLARLIPTFKALIEGIQAYIRYNASSQRILLNLKDCQNKKEIRPGGKDFPKKFKNIKLDNISFKYLGSKNYIFKNFSATIKSNQINAILGSSGAGKTTFIDMLPLLIQPESGRILIDEVNTKEINIKSLRNNFAYVDQKPIFFKGSIMENLSYSQIIKDEKKCINAAKLSRAHSFINRLPHKYDYQLGESGIGLSGGQLQRLEIAKALSTGRKIIILDEPTSNLDNQNSKIILETLFNINKKTKITIIVISHKKDIIKYASNVIRL